MNKTKFLSSLSVFLMVLSIAGCQQEDDNPSISESSELISESSSADSETSQTSESETTTSSDSSSEETPTGWNNFTLAFTFIDSFGETTSLPNNATAYIIGGWDNWEAYTPLVESDGLYCVTFERLDIATYRYKVVMWFSDEEVSWFNSVEITDGNQILRVRSTYSDNYVYEITLELNVSLPADEEKQNKQNTLSATMAILEAAEEVGRLGNLWDSIHIEAESPNDKSSYDVCINPDNKLFGDVYGYEVEGNERFFIYGVGSYEEYEWDTIDYYYYIDGLRYDYFVSNGNSYDPTVTVDYITYDNDYTLETLVNEYSKVFEDAATLMQLIQNGVDSNGNIVSYSIATEGNNYVLEVNSEAKGIYTYTCTSNFEFVKLAYDDGDGYVYEAEETTISKISEKIDLLRASFDLCLDPFDVFEKLYANCNYSVQLEFEQMVTDDYIMYKEYEEATDSELNNIIYELELSYQLTQEATYICYTDEAVFIRMGYMDDDGRQNSSTHRLPIFISDYGILLVNETTSTGDDCLYVYFSGDKGSTWELGSFTDSYGITHASDQPVYSGHWQDYCLTIGDCYGTITEDNLYYYGMQPRYSAVGGYTGWVFNDQDANNFMFKTLGGQFFFGDFYNEFLSTFMEEYLVCFDPAYQTMESSYYYEAFFPGEDFLEDGWELTDDTPLYIRYLEVVSTVQNMGSTDIADELANWKR